LGKGLMDAAEPARVSRRLPILDHGAGTASKTQKTPDLTRCKRSACMRVFGASADVCSTGRRLMILTAQA